MSITQSANRAWLHHHGKRKAHRILQPPFGKSTKDMAMSDLMLLCLSVIHQEKSANALDQWMNTPLKRLRSYHRVYVVAAAHVSFL